MDAGAYDGDADDVNASAEWLEQDDGDEPSAAAPHLRTEADFQQWVAAVYQERSKDQKPSIVLT